ncbi:SLC13 family permease [Acuticoccus sp. MNP-M23]|uniref:SLC13 family permease n=1 Tax=Acuticoccus sp. MNP-M23 TaxID=3072793 RepID=UPI0028150E9C|nr:SLC13 family permease [Acuticoccus sp. MNP-M23]WMS44936.1 SLC13 family permease [Acuticoccus sp. MNP-M23]
MTFAAFALEVMPPSGVAVAGAASFVALGVLSIDDVAGVLASPALLTIAAMFVISGALVRTGTLEWVAGFVTKRAESRPGVAIALILGGTLVASAFVNNMPVVLVLIPVMLRLAATAKIAPTRLLIPLSYAAVLGGTCTLIGTSTNLVVAGVAVEQGLAPFSIFEITPIGIAASMAGLATMALLARFVLPARGNASGDLDADDRSAFLSEITLTADYAGLGDTVAAQGLFKPEGIALQALVRGGEQIRHDFEEYTLEAGDRFVIAATREEILSLSAVEGIHVGKDRGGFSEDAVVVEAFLAPGRRGLRERLASLPLLHGRDIAILGVNRDRHLPGRSLNDVMLRPADRLMVRAEPDAVARLSRSHTFVSLTRTETRPFRRGRAPVAIGAAAAVVVLAALGVAPIGALALIAVAALLLLRCIDAEEAWSAIDGSLLVLIFGMLVIGLGLQQSGAIDIILSAVGPWFASAPPFLFIIALYALTSVMTELVTNNAVAVIVTPIAVALALEAGIDPRAAVVAVMAAASASFATPVGYQTNTLVYGAGDYRFADFLKIGIPMNITVGLASSTVIYWLWL